MSIINPVDTYARYIREVIGDEISDPEKLKEICDTLGKYVYCKEHRSRLELLSEVIYSLYERDREAIECDFARILVIDPNIIRGNINNRFEALKMLLPLFSGDYEDVSTMLRDIKREIRYM